MTATAEVLPIGSARRAAEMCLRRGWVPVPIPPRSKGPTKPKWEQLTRDGYRLDELFPAAAREQNIGLLLGEPSGGLIDVDLDCAEALAAARLLPGTGMVWGRQSAPYSHRAYVVKNPPQKATQTWNDPLLGRSKGARLIELRSTGGQTVLPPSIYPADPKAGRESPEPCVWLREGDPAAVELPSVVRAAARVASAALIGRYWAPGNRHDAALALAGGLLRAGWAIEDVEVFVEAVCAAADDEETLDRVRGAKGTFSRMASGEATTGWPKLSGLLGEHGRTIVDTVREWLGVRTSIPAEATKPDVAPSPDAPPAAWEIIRDQFRKHYRPGFKDGDSIYSGFERREVRRQEAVAALPPYMLGPLAEASNVPRFPGSNGQPGAVKGEALPGFFKKWAGTGWAGLLAELPDEDAAAVGSAAVELAAEEFRRLLREALLTPYTLGQDHVVGRGDHVETKLEKMPLANWCQRFAKPGPWRSIRNLKVWTKTSHKDGGELVYRIAIRHELFAQIKADRRLSEMGSNKFTRRAERYGVGKPGGQGDRPHGKWALVLDDAFVADLIGTADIETEDEGDGVA